MSPWLLLPGSAIGISPAEPDLAFLLQDTYRMVWVIFVPAVAILFVVVGMASRVGARTRDANEGSEMEKGMQGEAVGGEMRLRKGSGSGCGGVWRVE